MPITICWIPYIFDHQRSGLVYNLGPVCMSVCLSHDDFRESGRTKFIFTHAVYLHAIRVKFVYEGHRVKVKVTGAKKVENSYSRNVKLRSAITIEHRTTKFACSMRFSTMADRVV